MRTLVFAAETGSSGEESAAVLTDAAYAVALRNGAGGSWVDIEVEMWKAFRRAVAEAPPQLDLEGRASGKELLARLTDTAYRAVLKNGFAGSFLKLELELWEALRAVVRAAHEKRAKPAPLIRTHPVPC